MANEALDMTGGDNAAPVSEGADSGIDWSAMAAESDPGVDDNAPDLSLEEEPAAAAKAEPPPEAPKVEGKEEPPKKEEPAPQAAAPAIAPETAPAPQTPQAQEPPQAAPQQPQVDMEKLHNEYVASLEGQYQLSEEDAGKFVLSPNEVIPRLAANLHANIARDVATSVMQSIQHVLPNLIDTRQQQHQATSQAENDFFTQWPELKAHKDLVMQTGRLFRAQNPSASLQDFVQQVGMSAWISARLPVAELSSRLEGTAPKPSQPPAPAVQQVPPGYRPASPASTAPPTTHTTPENPFAALAEEIKREEFF
ncbi:MAG: hypothetical protein E4H01_13560 [Lysobacterales bacterium]|nr:MAG: hypothetical protein E4H01_13560 [Xanthomonadales bacterium]